MSEIKSTLDLVLERTRHMFQSDEEKKQEKRNELSGQAKGLVLKLQEGQIEVDDLPAALKATSEADRPLLKKTLIEALTAAVSLSEGNDLVFEALDAVTDGAGTEAIAALKGIVAAYRDGRAELADSIREKALQDLAALGISGSAVSPNLDLFPGYHQDINELEQKTRAALAAQVNRFA